MGRRAAFHTLGCKVNAYETEAMEILEKLFMQHEVVVLTGGSMMYVDAICKGIDDIPTVDAETRQLMLQKNE